MFASNLSMEGFRYLSDHLSTICINVPGSLLEPGVLRLDAFNKAWNSTMVGPDGSILPVKILENPCTPAEIVKDEHLTALAKRHDTFVPPGLKKALIAQCFSGLDLDLAKSEAVDLANFIILTNWDILVNILKYMQFKNCRDVAAVANAVDKLDLFDTVYPETFKIFDQVYDPGCHDQMLVGLLDALRTKLTRTACTESHRRAYEYLANQAPGKIGLILEDDLFIDPRFPDQLTYILANLNVGQRVWDIIQLGYSVHPERPIVVCDDLFSTAPLGAYGNTAVLVNSAEKILQILEDHRLGKGQILANDVVLAEADIFRFLAKKRLIGPPKKIHFSVLAGIDMDYSKQCWDVEELK